MTSVKRSETRIPPGLATLVLALLAWEAVSLFFPPVIFPGPWTLLERMVAIYSDPASYAGGTRHTSRLSGTEHANRWRETIWQKVKDCEAAKPFVQRVALGVTENWSYLRSTLQLILLPPLVVLGAWFMFGWIVRVRARR